MCGRLGSCAAIGKAGLVDAVARFRPRPGSAMKKPRVLFHTDIVIDSEKFNVAIHEDPHEGVWLMNVRPEKPSEEAEAIAMRFWKAVGGDGWKTETEAKGAIVDGLKKTKASEWNKWERQKFD